jgi:hypothetical protein
MEFIALCASIFTTQHLWPPGLHRHRLQDMFQLIWNIEKKVMLKVRTFNHLIFVLLSAMNAAKDLKALRVGQMKGVIHFAVAVSVSIIFIRLQGNSPETLRSN